VQWGRGHRSGRGCRASGRCGGIGGSSEGHLLLHLLLHVLQLQLLELL
jgi:hypothetical protein